LPIEDRNRIEANLDTAFVNLKLPFPNKVEMIAKLQSMGKLVLGVIGTLWHALT